MSFFNSLEQSLEKIIETTLLGRGSRVQPVEIARGLWGEMTRNKRVSINDTYVPNYFLVTLSPEDYDFLQSVRARVNDEILEYLRRESHKREFSTLGPLVIHWACSNEQKTGGFSLSSDFLETREIPPELLAPPASKGSKNPTPASSPAGVTSAPDVSESIHIIEGLESGRRIPLENLPLTIGRDARCGISIGDPTVSRRHARIFRQGEQLFIEDLQSRKGLLVDGRRVEKAPVEEGIRIKLGGTTFVFTGLKEKTG